MARKKKQVYASEGLTFEAGEMPECDYCGKTAAHTDLFETVFGGGVCCTDEKCRLLLADDCCVSEIELQDEED